MFPRKRIWREYPTMLSLTSWARQAESDNQNDEENQHGNQNQTSRQPQWRIMISGTHRMVRHDTTSTINDLYWEESLAVVDDKVVQQRIALEKICVCRIRDAWQRFTHFLCWYPKLKFNYCGTYQDLVMILRRCNVRRYLKNLKAQCLVVANSILPLSIFIFTFHIAS